ncbi:MAG: hypothetical protein ABJF11_13320 [Reichenbachiella sp.]|uniref:hypothetical protein n=1 Tax=Reichenbachiella sp. TaxID=2184521 RepID=UPI003266ADDB
MIRQLIFSIAIILFSSLAFAQNKADANEIMSILENFEGRWQGTATAYFPRDKSLENRNETIEAVGEKVLKDSYVELRSTWTQANGDYRSLITFWNYHIKKDSFQILYLYDNWPGRVDYALDYDSATRTFKGYDTFVAKGGIQAEEKVEWVISEDGNEIKSTEYNHLATDPDDYWPVTFEFVLRREE